MLCLSNCVSRLLLTTAILATVACGGGGSGGIAPADQAPEPTGEITPDPIDLPQVDFSPAIPIPGNPTSELSGSPIATLTLNYPASGIPAGNRMIVSAYLEDPDSLSPGPLLSQQVRITRGEASHQFSILADLHQLSTVPEGDVTLLIDAVVFNSAGTANPQLEYAVLPRSRVAFSAQEQDGQTVYERVAFERELEPITLASTPSAASYVEVLSPEDSEDAITIEHSSFLNETLYLLINYAGACEDDAFEVQFQVSESDLAAKRIPSAVRRSSSERCVDEASTLLTVSLDGVVERYAAVHNTVFDDIELVDIGSFTPKVRTFDKTRRFGTEPFCQTNPGCLANVELNSNGTVGILTYGNLSSGSRYSLGADGRTIYLQPDGFIIPPNGTALLSQDGRSVTLSFLGFVLFAQPDAYTDITVSGSVVAPDLDADKTYHASVILFSPAGDGIDILARAHINDFSAENADFLMEYKAEDIPPADPLSLQISAAIFSGDVQSEAPAALAFRTAFPGAALSFSNASADENVFESQIQTQVPVAEFSGTAAQIAAEVIEDDSTTESQSVADLHFASIYGNSLHLILGGSSACQTNDSRFQVYYEPENAIPQAGLPSRWLASDGAPCASPVETQLSIDLRPLMAKRAELELAALETLQMQRYGPYVPVLTVFPQRRVYVDSAGCFAQTTCLTSLDFRADGTLHYQRGPFIGTATYGISTDGRTIFSEGIPLSPEDSRAFLAADGQSMTTQFTGELIREL